MLKMKQRKTLKVAKDYLGIKFYEEVQTEIQRNSQECSLKSGSWKWIGLRCVTGRKAVSVRSTTSN